MAPYLRTRPGRFISACSPWTRVHSIAAIVPRSLGLQSIATSGQYEDLFVRMFTHPCANRYDELHPSEQTDRNIGKAIAAVVSRKSDEFTTWFS